MNSIRVISKPLMVGLIATAAMAIGSAHAALVTYTSSDLVASTSAPHPNTTAIAATFDTAAAAIGPVGVITFEGQPLGAFGSLAVAPGVSISGQDYVGANQTIRNTSNSPSFPTLDGFNTTSGGSYFVEMQGGVLTFTFTQPTQFFGVYLTGVQTNFFADSLTFNDGTAQTVTTSGVGTSGSVGAVSFVGFIETSKFISSITINAGLANNNNSGQDFIGVDDVRYQVRTTSVPEPAPVALTGLGLVMALAIRRRRRNGAA